MAKVLEDFRKKSMMSQENSNLLSQHSSATDNIKQSNLLQPDTLLDGNTKTLGKVLEEFKNKALLSLQDKGSEIQLVGPIYVVTNGPRAFSLFKSFDQQTDAEEENGAKENDSAFKRSLGKQSGPE